MPWFLRQRLPLNVEVGQCGWPVSSSDPPVSTPQSYFWSYRSMPSFLHFMWVPEIQAHVLMLVRQTLIEPSLQPPLWLLA